MGQSVLSAGFARSAGVLRCEGVPLDVIAKAAGTPSYVYSSSTVRNRYELLADTLTPIPHRIHYTLKANSNRALLRLVRSLGAGADVVSGGELFRARAAGFTGSEIIFGGVGKTERELAEALDAQVLLINVESEAELLLIDQLAAKRRVRAPISIRVNPEITVDAAHQYIRTGEKGHKFGVPFDDARRVAELAASLPHVMLLGLDMHLGSQLSRVDPYRVGTERLTSIAADLRNRGIGSLRYLDIGGGLGVRYDSEEPPDLARFAQSVLPLVAESGLQLIMEPGRFVVGNAGVLLTRVLYRKHSGGKEYVITDAGMTELLRPSHYGAFHRIEAVEASDSRIRADVVGPVCESGDFLALDREMQNVRPGDLLAVFDVGAYGFVMSSSYNSRPRGAEVLVDGDRFAIVTERENYETLVQQEVDDPEWRS
ncbi:MAG TPA: diaminopimelate decarboxylase [Gemmatimonadaceae bacterium]|jgi:diaminopimelate decarboxylase|nr:diaminopimelate decarboxylase [Gemmatimonadaceae bacterium]